MLFSPSYLLAPDKPLRPGDQFRTTTQVLWDKFKVNMVRIFSSRRSDSPPMTGFRFLYSFLQESESALRRFLDAYDSDWREWRSEFELQDVVSDAQYVTRLLATPVISRDDASRISFLFEISALQ